MSKEVIDNRLKTVEMVEKLHKTIYNQDQKIADLETKLAESEEEIKVIDEDRQFKAEMWTKFANKCKELEKQLAEKEKLINNYADDIEKVANENADLVFKLAEKDKEHMEAMQNALNDFLKLRQELNQDKISFCIDKLEKVKEFNIQQVFSSKPLDNFIYNQIKQLKGDE